MNTDSPTEVLAASDPRALRDALATFTTGVTIVTTRNAEGAPFGVTVNSFNSVSLEPPLVLWSLSKRSRSLEAFQHAEHWAVHILSAEQDALSARFARPGENKFGPWLLDDATSKLTRAAAGSAAIILVVWFRLCQPRFNQNRRASRALAAACPSMDPLRTAQRESRSAVAPSALDAAWSDTRR